MVIIIIAICQALKEAGVSTRFIPIISIILGILGATFYGGVHGWLEIAAGVATGLTASGLFSAFKKTILNK